jgi:4-amino-4-deoxy-L-arabinose transferase-like glycosyltransferase
MEANREIYDRVFLLARLPVVLLGLLTCWLVFRWARELYGDEAGLIALFLAVFFPSLIAHAHLATVDVGLCFFLLLALYLFWRYVQRPGTGLLIACGVALGLAELSKFTALILYPVFVLLAFRDKRRLAALVPIFLISVLVIDAGYLFQGIGRRVADFRFESKLLSSFLPAGLPMPLPADYLEGLDALQLINDVGEYPEYLFGRWSSAGSPAYYLVVILFKTPLPLLAALLLVPFARREARYQSFLWLPALVLLAFFSTSKVHYGIRYILPIFPLLFIWTSRLVPWVRTRAKTIQMAALVLLLIYPLSALVSTPDTLSYFNLLAGGRGDEILLDSNIDWGQGLKRVRAWMDREGLDRIDLAYFGHVDPAIYGISWDFPRPDHPGLVAVSANFLHGYPYATYASGRMVQVPPDVFTWIAKHPRVEDLGGGIFVYRIPG